MSVDLNQKGKIVFQNSGVTNSKSASIVAPTSMAADVSYTLPDAGSSCNLMTGRRSIIALSNAAAKVAKVLTVEESGALVTINAAADANSVDITLPDPATAIGVNYDFMVVAASHANTNATVTPAAGKVNCVLTLNNATASATGKDAFVFAKGAATNGTTAKVLCDGVAWNVHAVSNVAASVTAP